MNTKDFRKEIREHLRLFYAANLFVSSWDEDHVLFGTSSTHYTRDLERRGLAVSVNGGGWWFIVNRENYAAFIEAAKADFVAYKVSRDDG